MKKKIILACLILIFAVSCKKSEPSIDIPGDFLSWVKNVSGSEISGDNIINTLMYIELEVSGKQKEAGTYEILGEIVKTVKLKVNPSFTPLQKLQAVYQILENDFHISYLKKTDELFSQSLPDRNRDCDTGSYIYLAVAHELEWPLYAIKVPGHIYLCWEDGKEKFNFETTNGKKINNADYIINNNIDKTSIEQGVFFKKLTRSELTGNFFFDRGNYYLAHKEYDNAVSDYTSALKYNPKDAECYHNRGVIRIAKGEYTAAIDDFNASIQLNPNSGAMTFYLRGIARYGLKLTDDALTDFIEAVNKDRALYNKLPDEIKKSIIVNKSNNSKNKSEQIIYALRYNLNEGVSAFKKLHDNIFDLKTTSGYAAILPSINSQAANYTPEKELYILIKEEIVYVNLLNNEEINTIPNYLSEIFNYANICEDKYSDPTTMIEYYLMNNVYCMIAGKYAGAVEEIKKYESIVLKFNRPDDLAYIASIKECAAKKNKEKALEISRPMIKRMFDEHLDFIKSVMTKTNERMKTLIKEE